MSVKDKKGQPISRYTKQAREDMKQLYAKVAEASSLGDPEPRLIN